MFSNPLIRRYRISQFRPANLVVFGALYIGMLLLIFIINGTIYQYQTVYLSVQDLYKSLFTQFLIFQAILIWLLMPVNSSSAVPGEIVEKSIDFFRLLPLSSVEKTVGILVGRNQFYLGIAAVNFCIMAFWGIAGDIDRPFLVQILVLMVAGMIALNNASLLFSILSFKKSNNGISLLVVFLILCACPFVGVMINFVYQQEQMMNVFFFNYSVPFLLLAAGYFCIGAVWSFAGILRRFRYEYEPLFSRKGAVLFYACFLFLVYAMFHRYLLWEPFIPKDYPFLFALVSLLPLGIIPFSSMRTFDKYVEITRMAKHKDGLARQLLLKSNFLFNILLFGVWAATVLTACYLTQRLVIQMAIFCGVLFTVYLVIMALGEVYILYQPKAGKIGYLLAFIGGVYLILPLVLAGILDQELLLWFSPIGLIGPFIKGQWETQEIYMVLIYHCILLVIPLWLITQKYIAISRLRTTIESKE